MSTLIMDAPHRKPVAGYVPASASYNQQAYNHSLPPPFPSSDQDRAHSRSRTNSSSVMPYSGSQSTMQSSYPMTQPPVSQYPSHNAQYTSQPGQRTMSTASFAGANSNVASQRSSTMSGYSAMGGMRRSTSSRSNSSGNPAPTSYVALMRKQKATVWCDRAQHEDPRLMAAQRQAKMRAAAEVAGGHGHAAPRISTSSSGMVGGVRSKIRHHGAPKASAYSGANLAGAVGVPMRLSASEVDENDSDEDAQSGYHRYHSRTGSGRSSLGSGRKGTFSSSQAHLQLPSHSNSSTPPGGHDSPVDSMASILDEQTPVPGGPEGDDYFAHPSQGGGSGSSGEREESFGTVPGLPQQRGRVAPPEEQLARKQANADELRRRGSVDDRTMTMSAGRLFVANPDLSD